MGAPILSPTPENISRAAACLREGGLVAMPTETVYGLAANAADPAAVARLYQAKGRPQFNPLIAHLPSPELAFEQGDFSAAAQGLARHFWPGPLTLVVDAAPEITICDLARAGLGSVALRVPAHKVAQALLAAFGRPLVAPSANPSGRISPTTAQHVAADMGDRLDMILDGGPCSAGVESTIIDARSNRPALLRPGTIPADAIETIWPGLTRPSGDANSPSSPGQLLRHYAPNAKLRLNADAPREGEAFLGFGAGSATLNLSPQGDLTEASANLFAMLRALDDNHTSIAVAKIPATGLGEAINDRLIRAADRGDDPCP